MSINEVPSRRRKKVQIKNPNPLFEKWITEWKDEAANKGWKTQYVYAKALQSLRRYPLRLKSGKEAKILEYFGDKICKMLDDKLSEYRKTQSLSDISSDDADEDLSQPSQSKKNRLSQCSPTKLNDSPVKSKKTSKPRSYIPTPGTGPFAILVTLYLADEQEDKHFMKKSDLQEAAQSRCDTSFTVPVAGSRYTAWSSMSTLITKGLVIKDGNPARYSLTNDGKELAFKLAFSVNNPTTLSANNELSGSASSSQTVPSQTSHPTKTASSISSITTNSSPSVSSFSQSTYSTFKSSQSSQNSSECINLDEDQSMSSYIPQYTLKPGEYSIVLCVDNCETQGGSKGSCKKAIIPELQKNGVQFEIRKLHVGDFAWIAKQHVSPIPGQLHIPEPIELVLDYVIERKRLDDLAQSIKDGRYKEQKFRLKQSGVRNPIYLIEGYGVNGYNMGLPEKTLKQAYTNTQIQDDFMVKITKDQKDTVAYLTIMTRHLQRLYKDKTLLSCTKDEMKKHGLCLQNSFMTFKKFNTESMKRKKLSLKEIFVLQLMKIRGLSKEKAISIVKNYETPAKLIEAYRNCLTETEKEKLLSNIKVPTITSRNFGPALSKTVYQLYCYEKLT